MNGLRQTETIGIKKRFLYVVISSGFVTGKPKLNCALEEEELARAAAARLKQIDPYRNFEVKKVPFYAQEEA